MSESEGLTVLGLRAQNVKRIKLVEISDLPATGTVKIGGKNGAGKSTTCNLLLYAVGGKRVAPVRPIREGESRATEVVELQDASGQKVMEIHRVWTEGSDRLEIFDADGKPLKRPQELLDGLVGAGLGFDPRSFAGKKPTEQFEQLLGVTKLPEDPRALAAERKRLYDERTAAGRELKRVEGHKASLKAPAKDTPDEEVSVADLTAQYQRLVEDQRVHDQASADVQRAESAEQDAIKAVDRARAALVEAEKALEARQKATVQARTFLASKAAPDLAPVQAQLRDAEGINTAVREKKAYKAATAAVSAQEKAVDELSKQIKAIDDRKRDLLAGATFPIPGLGFEEIDGEWHVTYEGHPLKDSASSVEIRVGMAIAMATNPRLKVIIIREGSLLDDDAQAMVNQLALEHGYQVLMELVGDDDPEAFVLEAGGVIRLPQPRAKTEVAW